MNRQRLRIIIIYTETLLLPAFAAFIYSENMDIQHSSAALMARPGVTFAHLPQMNIPWTESPFFHELLSEQVQLTPEEKEQCIKYSQDGYFLVDDLEIPDFDSLTERIIGDVRGKIPDGYDRVQDMWKWSENVRRLALSQKIDGLLPSSLLSTRAYPLSSPQLPHRFATKHSQ